MPGPRFARLVPLLPVYGGAVAAALGRRAGAADTPSPLVAVPAAPSGPDVIIGTPTAIALSPHADLFEFGA